MYNTAVHSGISLLENIDVPLHETTSEFLQARAVALSPATIRDYRLTLERLCIHLPGNPPVSSISSRDIASFLSTIPGGKKNCLNAWIGLAAFWSWAITQGFATDHAPRRVSPPDPKAPIIIPFTPAEVNRLLVAGSAGRFPARDAAILKLMFDTGLRASEICGVRLRNLQESLITVRGKGDKERRVPVCPSTLGSIHGYLKTRKRLAGGDLMFVNQASHPLTRSGILDLFIRTGERAGIYDSHPHKARHTFAITYLRNGGDPYTLQLILGHSTMEMVRRYLDIVQGDLVAAHAKASPIANWGL